MNPQQEPTTASQEIPDFAAAWAAQWKAARPELERVRRQELQQTGDHDMRRGLEFLGVTFHDPQDRGTGMIDMQRRLMRLRILQLQRRVEELEYRDSQGDGSRALHE